MLVCQCAGISVEQFVQDKEYKRETILQLARYSKNLSERYILLSIKACANGLVLVMFWALLEMEMKMFMALLCCWLTGTTSLSGMFTLLIWTGCSLTLGR